LPLVLWQRWSWWSPLSLHAGVELAQCLTCDVARPIRGHFAVGQALLSLELEKTTLKSVMKVHVLTPRQYLVRAACESFMQALPSARWRPRAPDVHDSGAVSPLRMSTSRRTCGVD
jgi:hypothetical protein